MLPSLHEKIYQEIRMKRKMERKNLTSFIYYIRLIFPLTQCALFAVLRHNFALSGTDFALQTPRRRKRKHACMRFRCFDTIAIFSFKISTGDKTLDRKFVHMCGVQLYIIRRWRKRAWHAENNYVKLQPACALTLLIGHN